MFKKGVVSIDAKDLGENEIRKIYEIEKDMWAREDGLGEYIKCNCCGEILSKEQVFGNLSSEIQSETVSKIELIVGNEFIKCSNCNSLETEFLFGEDYIDEIKSRYFDSESYVSLFYDSNSEIRGFIDGYVDNYDVIYEREFKIYYEILGKDFIKNLIESSLGEKLPDKILFCSSLGFEKKFINFITIIELLKSYFFSIKVPNSIKLGITELSLGTRLQYFHLMNGLVQVGVKDYNKNIGLSNHNEKFNSDIFIQKNMPLNYRESLSEGTKPLIVKFKNFLNSINV